MKKLVFYCDMDGVLADFNNEANALQRFKSEKGFFKNLQPIDVNIKGLKNLLFMGYDVKILSTSPHNRADREKRFWLQKHLPMIKKENMIFARPNEPKINYITSDKDISVLIDDYGKNVREWLAGGGLHSIKITDKMKHDERDYKNIQEVVKYLWEL